MRRGSRLLDLDPRTVAWILIVCAAVVLLAFHPALRRHTTLRTVARTPQPAPVDLRVLTERAGAPSIPDAPQLDASRPEPEALALADPDDVETMPDGSRTLELELARWPDLVPVAQRSATVSTTDWHTTGTSDDAGFVALTLPAEVDLSALRVTVPGFQPRNLFLAETERVVRKALPLRPARGYAGTVLDRDGNPAAGVEVVGWYVETPRPRFGTQPTTDEKTHLRMLPQRAWAGFATKTTWKGTYYVSEPDEDFVGELAVAVVVPGLSTTVVRVSVPRVDRELPALQLRTPRVVKGVVVDAQARPLAGASVHATLADGASIDFPPTLSDENGHFELVAPEGEVLLYADKVGYRMRLGRLQRTAVRIPRPAHGPLDPLQRDALATGWHEEKPYVRAVRDEVTPLILDATASKEIFVYESGVPGVDSRHALTGVEVRVRYADAARTEILVETSRDGIASVPRASRGLQPVQLSLALKGYDYQRSLERRLGYATWYQERGEEVHEVRLARVPIRDEDPDEVRVQGFLTGLPPGETGTVRVYSAGTGAPGLLASIEIGALETDERGAFSGELPWELRGGSVRVVASAGSGDTTCFASSALIELTELRDQDLRLRLEPAARVVLRPIFPATGEEWTVDVRASSAPGFSDLWSRKLTLRRDDETPPVFHLPIGASVLARAERHGEEVALRVSLPEEALEVPLPELVTISGSAAGANLSTALVGLEDADGRHAAYARPDPDGSFRFEDCLPGVYDVFLYARAEPGKPLEHRAPVDVLAVARVTANDSRHGVLLEPVP